MLKSKIKKLEQKLQPEIKNTGLENIANADVIIIDSLAKFMVVYDDEPCIKPGAKILWDKKFRKQFLEAFAEDYPEEILNKFGIKKPENEKNEE